MKEVFDRRMPFGKVYDKHTPGPYDSAHCFELLSNQPHFPTTKFSQAPKYENTDKRFYSWDICKRQNIGAFSPGPIYPLDSDFDEQGLPPRPKYITKRQAAPWQREECPGEAGVHSMAWGDGIPGTPEKGQFHNPLFPYKNAHTEVFAVLCILLA